MMVSDWLLGTYAYARAAQSCFAHWWWLNRTRFLNSRNQPLLCDCMKCRTVCSKSHKVCNNDFCSFEWISSIVRVYSFSSLFFFITWKSLIIWSVIVLLWPFLPENEPGLQKMPNFFEKPLTGWTVYLPMISFKHNQPYASNLTKREMKIMFHVSFSFWARDSGLPDWVNCFSFLIYHWALTPAFCFHFSS